MSVEIIVFDLGKVIFDFDFEKVIKDYYKKTNIMPDFTSVSIMKLLEKYELGNIDSQKFFEQFAKESKFNGTYNEFKVLWNNIFTPIADMVEIIGSIAKNYPLAALSNTNEMHFNYLIDRYPRIFMVFKKLFLSHEMHLRKPDENIYKAVIDYFNVEPSKIFFTDDIFENVEAASKLSIKAYQFTNPKNLIKSLKDEGIRLC
jgi:putative hydrolase of the HAD superfamily